MGGDVPRIHDIGRSGLRAKEFRKSKLTVSISMNRGMRRTEVRTIKGLGLKTFRTHICIERRFGDI